jgi:hypothetical protein
MWRDNFTSEEQAEIDRALVADVMHFEDFRGYELIAKMADALDQMEDRYNDRNLLVLLAGRLALGAGYKTGITPISLKWSTVFIDLPNGQVSFVIPIELIEGLWPTYDKEWDGAEVRSRVQQFVR